MKEEKCLEIRGWRNKKAPKKGKGVTQDPFVKKEGKREEGEISTTCSMLSRGGKKPN